MASKIDYAKILSEAFATAERASFERPYGCCRVYVHISSKEHRRGISAAAKKIGKIYQAKGAYGATHVLYVGYDNNSGRALGQGNAIVNVLKQYGIDCYRDEYGD